MDDSSPSRIRAAFSAVWIVGHIRSAAVLSFCFLTLGCGDTVKVTNVLPFTNQPPTIVAQGPAYGPGPIDIGRQGAPAPYIIVADPNGVSDIAETFFKIDTAIVHGMIARHCAFVTYNPSDTIDVLPLIPPTFTDVVLCVMPQQRTLFSIDPFPLFPGFAYGCSAFPPIRTASASFGPPLVGCVSNDNDRLVSFGVYPPAVSSPIDISITYLDVEYRGISATVYDASGATAVARWPNLRIIYTTEKERGVAPGSPTAHAGAASVVPLPADATGSATRWRRY